MAPVTEIALLPLKEGKYPDSEGSTTSAIHNELVQTVLRQPGCQRLYWSREDENPDNLRWFLDWDSIEDHKNFMKSADYKPFLEQFGELLGGSPHLWHVSFEPHPPSAALKNATELLHVYFPLDLSKEDAADFEQRIKKFASVIKENAGSGYTGFAGGWVEEELEIPGQGEKGKAYSAFVGWQSLDAHHAFRESQAFKDNIHLLREAKQRKAVNMVHVHSKEVRKA